MALLALAAHLTHLLTLAALLRTHLAQLLPLLSHAALLLAHLAGAALLASLTHLLALLAARALAHGIELGENGAFAVHIAQALALVHLTTVALAVHARLIAHTGAIFTDYHHGTTGAVAAGSGRAHGGIVSVVDNVNDARCQVGLFGDDVMPHLVHLLLVDAGITLGFGGAKKISQVLMPIPHIPTFVREFLAGEIDAGIFLAKFFG